MRPENKNITFSELGIAPNLLDRLDQLTLFHPTPIQEKTIPQGIAGEDLIGIAQTGTGKTLAFAIPVMQRVAATKKIGLVILPTRELALQVDETFKKVGSPFGLRTAILIGGASMHAQLADIRRKPHVVIATPGRLIDHMDQKNIRLDTVGTLVLDEADRMLDMGFEPQLKRILAGVPTERQTLLFSATMPEAISTIARKYMKKPLRIEVAPSGTTAERVNQEVFIVPKPEKVALLKKVLGEYRGTVLVFSRTKHGAKKIAREIRQMGHTSAELHSNRSLAQRKDALNGFKSGKYRVLVATDIAARGIDVTGIELVLNFDLPDHTEDYVHRIGRTGRAGRAGKAISFAVPEQKNDIRQIERLIRMPLAVKTPSGQAVERKEESHPMQSHQGRPRFHRNRQQKNPPKRG
ncbi:DEAD/DEAH box helicase [Candidatus Parcubacteria bacterium]|nr:DEAD/DEAH box helicase [Candidatus Parcubacteria bacterium]